MLKYKVENFIKGLITSIEAKSIEDGTASANTNWLTRGDKIELRRGTLLTGTENTGTGRITGLFIARRSDGTEIPFRSHDQKIEYYSSTTSDWVEVGTNILGSAADGEDVSFAQYSSSAGDQLWISSPNSSLFKIMLANPGSYTDMYDAAKNHKGRIQIKFNRMLLVGKATNKTALYGSHIDEQTYTTETSENIGTGNGVLKTFAETLNFKAGGAKRTCFGISVTDGTETFTDNYDGTLTGSAGGSGTINYTSGAISVTFNAAVTNSQAITATYQWEDSTNGGIADFTESATRVAGEGFIFLQDDGGAELQTLASYSDIEYCIHRYKTWKLELTADDTNATNLIFRDRVGIPYHKAAASSGDGIYLIDNTDEKDTKFRLLQFETGSVEVIPKTISNNLDLSDYLFDYGVVFEWGDYVLFACRHKTSTINNVVFIYNKLWNSWDKMEQYVSCFGIYDGTLWAGDSLSDNVYVLFSGFDDDDSLINNSWESNASSFKPLFAGSNTTEERLKKVKKLVITGEIQKDQVISVYADYDNSGYVLLGSIEGDGSYVDAGQAVYVGAATIGSKEIGGGGDGVNAYNYVRQLSIRTDKFQTIKLKFEATGIGYASVSSYTFYDIRRKESRINEKYRA